MISFVEFISTWLRTFRKDELANLPEISADALEEIWHDAVHSIASAGELSQVADEDVISSHLLTDMLRLHPKSFTAGTSLQKLHCLKRVKYCNWDAVVKHINKAQACKAQRKAKFKKVYIARNDAGVATRFDTLKAAVAVGFKRNAIVAAAAGGHGHMGFKWTVETVVVEPDQLVDSVSV